MDPRIYQAMKIVKRWDPENDRSLKDVVSDAMCEMEYAAPRANGEVGAMLELLRIYPHLETVTVGDFI